MKINISLELDYITDKDLLFFLSNEKLVTSCIKTMTVKKDKTDKVTDNTFDTIMNKGFIVEGDNESIVDTQNNNIINSDDNVNDSYIQ